MGSSRSVGRGRCCCEPELELEPRPEIIASASPPPSFAGDADVAGADDDRKAAAAPAAASAASPSAPSAPGLPKSISKCAPATDSESSCPGSRQHLASCLAQAPLARDPRADAAAKSPGTHVAALPRAASCLSGSEEVAARSPPARASDRTRLGSGASALEFGFDDKDGDAARRRAKGTAVS